MSEFQETDAIEKQEDQVAERFKEEGVLRRVPIQHLDIDVDETKEVLLGEFTESVLAVYEETGQEVKKIPLQVEQRRFKCFFGDARVYKGEESENPVLVDKTTAGQLIDIIEEHGNPTKIHYTRVSWEMRINSRSHPLFPDFEKEDCGSWSGFFPFSEIAEDLGL